MLHFSSSCYPSSPPVNPMVVHNLSALVVHFPNALYTPGMAIIYTLVVRGQEWDMSLNSDKASEGLSQHVGVSLFLTVAVRKGSLQMDKLISLVGSVGRRRWRLKEISVLAILLAVAVASTDSTAWASIHEGDTTRIAIGATKPALQAFNTATGMDALLSNTTGDSNTATGHSALRSNTEGSFNTATGTFELSRNTTGREN